MSIATQIQRLINAKKAIKSSIVNKSVTVADTVKLDGYGTLINQIGVNANIGPNDVIKGKMAFGNNGKYFNGTALSVQTSANNTRILNGFTAYDSNGQLLTGNAMPTAATALNNRIMNGFTAYDNQGNLLKGNAFINNTNATNASLLKGHTAYLNNGFYLNGTAFGSNTNANNAVILKGYSAYLNNGFYLQGTALGNTTNALNNHILKGYTAYNSNGGWLVGNAFGGATNATNAQILNNYTAYHNNGVLLKGNIPIYNNIADIYTLDPGQSESFKKGYYPKDFIARSGINFDYGMLYPAAYDTIQIEGLSFQPQNFILIPTAPIADGATEGTEDYAFDVVNDVYQEHNPVYFAYIDGYVCTGVPYVNGTSDADSSCGYIDFYREQGEVDAFWSWFADAYILEDGFEVFFDVNRYGNTSLDTSQPWYWVAWAMI